MFSGNHKRIGKGGNTVFLKWAAICLLLSVFILDGGYALSHGLPGDEKKKNKTSAKQSAVDSRGFKTLLPSAGPSSATGNASSGTGVALNPQVEGFKEAYVKRENHEMSRMKQWGRPYFAIYDRILTQYGLPLELKYLSVIESSLSSGMRSWAGAVGPWQLMYDEALHYGLRIQPGIDERTDYYKSTEAAARLLRDLHQQFGDWLLVIAAYNAGPGAVRRAISKAGSDDFWKLQYSLPQETRNHVKKFISTHYFFEGGGGITTMTKQEARSFHGENTRPKLTKQELENTASVSLRGFYNGEVISHYLHIEPSLFEKLNPGFNKNMANGREYNLRLPKDKIPEFEQKKQVILEKCFQQLLG